MLLDDRWRLEEGYRIDVFEEQDAVAPEDVLALWEREGAINRDKAELRIHEVHLVATHEAGDIAGVSTAFLKRSPQLRMDLWHYRAFVPDAHRMSNVAVNLAVTGREHLERRFVSGHDPRGAGIIYEVENEGLKRSFNDAIWYPADVAFIGENERGDHVRVRYFPGALAPDPSA